MTQQDKDLLLRDLSARLPYRVYVRVKYKEGEPCYGKLTPRDIQWFIDSNIEVIKPYLRPMSSMTKDEEKEYNKTLCVIRGHGSFCTIDTFDYLISHGFDVHDLIPKGLAIEVTEENNPYK